MNFYLHEVLTILAGMMSGVVIAIACSPLLPL